MSQIIIKNGVVISDYVRRVFVFIHFLIFLIIDQLLFTIKKLVPQFCIYSKNNWTRCITKMSKPWLQLHFQSIKLKGRIYGDNYWRQGMQHRGWYYLVLLSNLLNAELKKQSELSIIPLLVFTLPILLAWVGWRTLNSGAYQMCINHEDNGFG